jgi:hypothetical protein
MQLSLWDRFHSKLSPDKKSGCWLWTAHLNCGYGVIAVGAPSKKLDKAHRIAFQLYRGPIPDGLFVLHKCDVRACCNPDHLFLGTNADNMADMAAKGRACLHQGVTNGRAKLTEDNVREIRRRHGRQSQPSLAKEFGVCRRTIQQIQYRNLWPHLQDAPAPTFYAEHGV